MALLEVSCRCLLIGVTTVVTRFRRAGSTTPLDVAKTRIMLETVEEGVKLLVKLKLR